MGDWNAQIYDNFAEQRQEAARDLVAAIPPLKASFITDLGCGSGLSTALLAERWPEALISALDQSPDMLAKASQRVPRAEYLQGDIAGFIAKTPQDIILANASLHWLADHQQLLPSLARQLAPQGVLAVQMPNTLPEPSHRLMSEIAQKPAFASHLNGLNSDRGELLTLFHYYNTLAPQCDAIKLWETHYHHVLDGPKDILRWFSSTGLKPYLDMLPEEKRSDFQTQYLEGIAHHYPVTRDGKVLLRLPRIFIIARRRAS